LKTVGLATLSFAIAVAATKLVIPLAFLLRSPRRSSMLDDLLLAGYLMAVSVSLITLGFLIPSLLSATWRRLPVWRAARIAGVLGLVSPIVSLLLLAGIARPVVPLFHSAAWLAIGILQGGPGVVLGLVAIVIAYARAKR
jgi:hypothetical protein